MMLSKEEIISQAEANKDYTGVYFLVRYSSLVYIGSSFRIGKRIRGHHGSTDFDCYSFVEVKTKDRKVLQTVEAEYILKYRPKLNKFLPSNNKYVSINSFLSETLVKIEMRHKVELLKQNGFDLINLRPPGKNFIKNGIWYIDRKIRKEVELFLIRNFKKLEELQEFHDNLKIK